MLLKNKVLLDTSCYMAVIREESGCENIESLLSFSSISMVNLGELIAALIKLGMSPRSAEDTALDTVQDVMPFTQEIAILSGKLFESTKRLGLSLGDRACIATGMIHKIPIYTCDRIWAELDLDCDIRLIR